MGHFSDGELDGASIYFDGDGQVVALFDTEDGKVRSSTSWDDHGRKSYEFVGGDDGRSLSTLWHPGGTPRLRAEELDGEYHGKFETWYESGSRKSLGHYERGRRVGVWRCWNETGERKLEVAFGSDGRLEDGDLEDGAGESWMRACTATCRGTRSEPIEVARLEGGDCPGPAGSREEQP
jgi:antitoxin component YwqK of YwqJK toxin-antitoxin module